MSRPETFARGYAAAKQPPGRAPWYPPRGGPNAPVGAAAITVAARARDAVRNNPYAARIVEAWVCNLVATGVTTRWPSRAAADLWEQWSGSVDCDAEGSLNWAGLQALAVRATVEGGESLLWFRPAPVSPENPVGLRVKVIEGDRLDAAKTGFHEGRHIVQGIEIDGDGRPVAYWLDKHDDRLHWIGRSREHVRVPASEIVHLYRRRRPGQLRDVSWLAPVLWALRDLTEYELALVRKAYVEACLAVVVTDDDGAAITEGQGDGHLLRDADGNVVEDLQPQMILYRRGGGAVDTINPSGGGSHEGFARRTLEGAAVGVGLTYDQLSGDLTRANYSSLRAGKVEFRRLLEQLQYTLLLPFCDRVARRFWRAAEQRGLVVGPFPQAVKHVPVAPEMVDPAKDTQALLAQVRAGFLPPQEAVGMLGSDFEDVMRQIAAANALADDLGVILDSDARRTARGGGAQDAGQNAAIEIAATGAAMGDDDEEES